MNITTNYSHVSLATTNPPTDSVVRDNAVRPVIPPPAPTSPTETNTGLSTDRDKAQSSAVIASQIPTYEQPDNTAINEAENPEQQAGEQENHSEEDNEHGHDHDGSHHDAHDSDEKYTDQEQAKLDELKAQDAKVTAHEQAHAGVGGQYSGSPNYSYETGPDGVKYAISGEVSIDTSKISDNPQATLIKAQQIKRAALAPIDPSTRDRIVANKADRLASEARQEILSEASTIEKDSDKKSNDYTINNSIESESFNNRAELAKDPEYQQTLANRRVHIDAYYHQSSQINENSSFQEQI